ncbi:MAG: 3-deoxy-manno-octulosonate cytidylyltransferase [bacterium]
MKAIAVIPARFGSSRFPGKPLALLAGKPIIEHVFERASMCSSLDDVIVATDDRRILKTVEGFGGKAVMTSVDHRSGSDRLGEAANDLDADIIVNVQGDEPLLEPAVIEAVLGPMRATDPPDIATVAAPLTSMEDYLNPDVVKVVADVTGRAVYFSRSSIPHGWAPGMKGLRHIGIYAYLRESLLRFVSLPESYLESLEKLEQLRAIDNGMRIDVVYVKDFTSIGVDRPEDLEKAEKMIKGGLDTPDPGARKLLKERS